MNDTYLKEIFIPHLCIEKKSISVSVRVILKKNPSLKIS